MHLLSIRNLFSTLVQTQVAVGISHIYRLPYSVGPNHQAISTNNQEGRNNQIGQVSDRADVVREDGDAEM